MGDNPDQYSECPRCERAGVPEFGGYCFDHYEPPPTLAAHETCRWPGCDDEVSGRLPWPDLCVAHQYQRDQEELVEAQREVEERREEEHIAASWTPRIRADIESMFAKLVDSSEVDVTDEEVREGEAEYERLTTIGPGHPVPFIDTSKFTPDERRRTMGLCARTPWRLAHDIIDSRHMPSHLRRFLDKSLCCLGSWIANRANHPGSALAKWSGTKPFAYYGPSMEPFWLVTHDFIVGPSGVGKGVALANLREMVGDAAIVETFNYGSIQGLAGSAKEIHLKGQRPQAEHTPGVYERTNHGIVQFPEFSSVFSMARVDTGGQTISVLAYILESGMLKYDWLKGKEARYTYALSQMALQPDFWDLHGEGAVGLVRRCSVTWLPMPSDDEQEEEIRFQNSGRVNTDKVALAVFRAKVRLLLEVRPKSLDYSAIATWHIQAMRTFRETRDNNYAYEQLDGQRLVALAVGYAVMNGGYSDADLALPVPDASLSEIYRKELRARQMLRMPRETRAQEMFLDWLASSDYLGTPDKPQPRTVAQIISMAASKTGLQPRTIKDLLYGRGYGMPGLIKEGYLEHPEGVHLAEDTNRVLSMYVLGKGFWAGQAPARLVGA